MHNSLRNMHTSTGSRPISKRLLFSYVFDWLIIFLIAVAAGVFTLTSPNHHPFSLVDPNISFPYVEKEKVPNSAAVILSLVAPGVIIAIVCLVFVPGPTVPKDTPKALIWRRKLWELNTGWLGLALAVVGAIFFTQGMKNLFGKPRPDLLSRCDPDLANIEKYAVGGLGSGIPGGIYLVDWHICREPSLTKLNDGFASFFSGHSAFSCAGLIYLSLFLCSKFAITIPYLQPGNYETSAFSASNAGQARQQESSSSSHAKIVPLTYPRSTSSYKDLRAQAAAPPTYLLVLILIPVAGAIYISSTRWSDFRHHGFDIIVGMLIGFLLAWGSFRWYHAPIRRGAGWSWGPRSVDKAWGIGLGVQSYAGDDDQLESRDRDVERAIDVGVNGHVERSVVHGNRMDM